jgi:hypothetical protein
MAAGNATRTGSSSRREPGKPKGRPTPGRRDRNAAARAAARRRRRRLRLWWAAGFAVVIGLIALFIALDTGAAPTFG